MLPSGIALVLMGTVFELVSRLRFRDFFSAHPRIIDRNGETYEDPEPIKTVLFRATFVLGCAMTTVAVLSGA